jgi:hypothetical protein
MSGTPSANAPLPTLDYANALSRYGVVVDEQGDSVSIRVPKAGWRRVAPVLSVLIATIGLLAGSGIWLAIAPGHLAGFAMAIALFSFIGLSLTVVILAGTAPGTGLETQFTLDRGTLAVVELGTASDEMPNGRRDWKWSIGQIGTIKGDLYGMGLTVQVIGTDLREFMHGHPEPVRRGVATLLNEGIERFAAR